MEPHNHRSNAAKISIHTFKDIFSGLCAIDKDFPVSLWGTLQLQAMDTLNMLSASRKNSKLSAH